MYSMPVGREIPPFGMSFSIVSDIFTNLTINIKLKQGGSLNAHSKFLGLEKDWEMNGLVELISIDVI
jgi:hypothetical protein